MYFYYLSIVLCVLFIGLFVNYLLSNKKEGLKNMVSENDVNNLENNSNDVKESLQKFKSQNDDLNNQLDELEKKVNCKNKKNSNSSDATKSKCSKFFVRRNLIFNTYFHCSYI